MSEPDCPFALSGKCEHEVFEELGNGEMMCVRRPYCRYAALFHLPVANPLAGYETAIFGKPGDESDVD